MSTPTVLSHMPTKAWFAARPRPTPENPLRVLFSGCLAGWKCSVDGSTYGEVPQLTKVLTAKNVRVTPFCPEDIAMGTPRGTPNCEGGNGLDVLDGGARFIVENTREDYTDAIVAASKQMLSVARAAGCEVAILMSISGACGTEAIYDGPRQERRYQRGPGVAAAVLIRGGILAFSQRDMRTLGRLHALIDPSYRPDPEARDAFESSWFQENFG